MADKVLVELVTPVEVVLAREVDMVVVPGGDGDFGILPGHAPLLSTLRPGVVDIYEAGAISDSVFVADGFAEATEARVTILAEEALTMSEATAEEADARLKEARRRGQSAERSFRKVRPAWPSSCRDHGWCHRRREWTREPGR